MPSVVTIAGSPTHPSRSAGLLNYAAQQLEQAGLHVQPIIVRDLPAEALIHGRYDDQTIQAATAGITAARGVIVATPVYKATYTGVLKTFLDLCPAGALAGKVVMPLVTGGSASHSLALEYGLKPVLAALGAGLIVNGQYFMDSQIEVVNGTELNFKDQEAEAKFRASLDAFAAYIAGLTQK
ncbi:MAG: NADPH-dependent FMN reductase [Anaerolineae bacterium]|nr:NADPH-dependent FMN reductase [Anaerolineae bacterium]